MAVGYRSVLRLDDRADAVSIAEEHLRAWLKEKSRGRNGLPRVDWEGVGVTEFGPAARLSVTHVDRAEDSSFRRLYQLEETNAAGTFVVSIYALSLPHAHDRKRQSLVIDVSIEGIDPSSAVDRVDPPRVVTALLETVDAWDGFTRLTGKPRTIHRDEVGEVLSAIADQDRSSAVIVAGSLGRDTDSAWTRTIESLTKQSVGVASIFVVLADGMSQLADELPASHEVRPGTVRTFAPRVELDDPDDGVRHRFLGPASLARAVEGTRVARALTKYHAAAGRRRLVEQDLPADIRRGVDLLRKAAVAQERASKVGRIVATSIGSSRDVDAALAAGRPSVSSHQAPRDEANVSSEHTVKPPPETATGAVELLKSKLRSMIRRWFSRDSWSPDDLDELDALLTVKSSEAEVAEQQLDEAADLQLRLEAELRAAHARLEELDLELALVTADLRESARETQVLRRNLVLADRAEETHVAREAVEWQPPTSVEELVARITPGEHQHVALDRVMFTGDIGAALDIDKRDPHGRYAAALWDYVHVLYDYVGVRAEGGVAGGVHVYLSDDRMDGHKCSPDRHAGTESESVLTNRSWREERVLPVPTDVDASGKVLMGAHFKPTHRDTFAPRMHYFDDADRSQMVYIGYIGRHLTNKKT
ncbi:hypothetical protein [Agromyces atrinae]|uniref:Uncharacterized protein n=1 Tax=Agromyces atrinae TaxID=592376 RepID=A0A4Q2MBI3_9MICO|nr:hypothetical protein [Agromyces atrinae]NYD66774.1 hypothetical protein [Agromyces atrinae]RXZ87431.1 hypothetical protein ESP50_05805 [Agromyces atrinae]